MKEGLAGFLNVRKPSGVLSYSLVRRIKKLLPGHKVGHSGILDIGASGVMVIAIGPATRFLEFINLFPKTYSAGVLVGISTDTDDASGRVVAAAEPPSLTLEAVRGIVRESFVGTFRQVPPRFSSLKYRGKRFSWYALRGQELPSREREVTIYDFEVLGMSLVRAFPEIGRKLEYEEGVDKEKGTFPEIRCRITASTGTYVRSVARDLGEKLGSYGMLFNLLRESVGRFSEENSIDVGEGAETTQSDIDMLLQNIVPLEEAFLREDRVILGDLSASTLIYGKEVVGVPVEDIVKGENRVAGERSIVFAYSKSGRFIGVARIVSSGRGQFINLSPLKILREEISDI